MSHRGEELTVAARALRLLARRDYTRRELGGKLGQYVEDPAELEALLDDLCARGWLSETRVLEQVIHAKRERFGPARIRQLLVRRGVPDAAIEPALVELRRGELAAAHAVGAGKFGTPGRTSAEQAKQVRFLQSRGFSAEVAIRVVRRRDGD